MEVSETSKKTEQILNDLTPGERTVCPLPHDGYLFLEHDVPFIEKNQMIKLLYAWLEAVLHT